MWWRNWRMLIADCKLENAKIKPVGKGVRPQGLMAWHPFIKRLSRLSARAM
ncbi:MAG: hypothetical protein ACLUKN_10070 [Bacilli bacterium]